MRESAVRIVAWIYEIRTIPGPNFGTYFAPKNDFILEALPRAGARVSRFRFLSGILYAVGNSGPCWCIAIWCKYCVWWTSLTLLAVSVRRLWVPFWVPFLGSIFWDLVWKFWRPASRGPFNRAAFIGAHFWHPKTDPF